MKFFNMLPGQRLILISATTPTSQTAAPVIACSTNRRTRTPRAVALLSAITVLLCWYVGRPLVRLHNKSGQIGAGAGRAIRNAWPPITVEDIAVIRVGVMFALFAIGILAAMVRG